MSAELRELLARQRKCMRPRTPAGTQSLVRSCRESGVGLVPCDPMGTHCPPDERLKGTEYEHMYSVLGAPHEQQFVVRCVPPELVQVDPPEPAPNDAAVPVEVRELALDRRLRKSLRSISARTNNVHDLAAWMQQAPCDAIPPIADGQCKRMRFANHEAGGRCIETVQSECQDNLAEVQHKVDRASTQLMRLVRRMKSKLRQLQKETKEESIDEALHLVARGMEDQVYAQHVCSMHQTPEACSSEQQAHCQFNDSLQQCQTYTCRAFTTQNECRKESSCTWNENAQPATCETTAQCNDRQTQAECSRDNECMWDGSQQCVNGIDAVRHIIDVANLAEAEHRKGGMLNEILISQVQADDPWPVRRWKCVKGNCRSTTEGGVSREECNKNCEPQPYAAERSYAHNDRVKMADGIWYAKQDVPPQQPPSQGSNFWTRVTMEGGGLSGARLGKLVRLMTRIMREYNTLLTWSPKLRQLLPTYRAAVQLDATCTGPTARCHAAKQHKLTQNLTWETGGALAPSVFPHHPPAFEEPTLQLA